MSFDWLNVPGLDINNSVADTPTSTNGTPPSVSFDFNQAMIQGNQQSTEMVPPKKNNPFANNNTSVQISNSSHAPLNQQPQQYTNQAPPAENINNYTNNEITTNEQQYNEDGYVEAHEDLQVPLSLSQLQLSHEELRTYLRWYKYITTRTHGKLVRLSDVFKFLHNFDITDKLKERIFIIFRTCKNSLNIGHFFAVLRLISLAVCKSILPTRRMISEKATVPKPKPILNSQTDGEVYEEVDDDEDSANGNKPDDSKVDFDSFTSLLLTGKSTRKRIRRRIKNAVFRNKKVRFSEHITFQELQQENTHEPQAEPVAMSSSDVSEEGPLDLSLPMDQLLKVMARRKEHNTSLISKVPTEQQETEEEKEELKDMKDSLSHFKQIRGPDSASLIPATYNNGSMGMTPQQLPLEPLKPTSTGSANHFMRQEYNPDYSTPNAAAQPVMEPLKPTATGSANYLVRSHQAEPAAGGNNSMAAPSVSFQQTGGAGNMPQINEPLRPTATGSANYLMKQHIGTAEQANASPNQTAGTVPVQQNNFMNFPQHRVEIQSQPQQQTPQQHQIPTHSLAQQNSYQAGNYSMQKPSQPLSQQNTISNHNGMLQQQATYPLTERNNMNYLSPQHTQQQQPQSQQTLPQQQPQQQSLQQQQPQQQSLQQQQPQQQSLQQQQHVQQQNTMQNNNMLSASNAANNYFQSLLSHTPSPNGSNLNLPNSNNLHRQYNQAPINVTSPQMPQQNIQPTYTGMNTTNNTTSYQQNKLMQSVKNTGNVNNTYQMMHSNVPQHQQQQNQQQQQQQQQQQRQQHQQQQQQQQPLQQQHAQYMMNQTQLQNQMQPQGSGQAGSSTVLFGNPVQSPLPTMATNQHPTNQGQYLAPNQYGMYARSNSHSPINGQSNAPIANTSSGGQDILGNYHTLQQQVNALQNRYR